MTTVYVSRCWRVAVTAALGAGLLAAGSSAAHAQNRCLPSGAPVAPVPWSQQLLNPERAWPFTTGVGQRVAVVSTGVDGTPLLDGAVAASTDLAPAPQFGEPSGAADCLGIGTGVAGIIAAEPTGGIGFHGTAPDARILSAKVVGDQYPTGDQPAGAVTPGVLADGIDWAVDRDATVIVVPTVTYQDSGVLRDAVARALAADIVVVASAGDLGQQDEPPGLVAYPSGHEGVIGVGGVGQDLGAGISRAGHVDLVAPGADLAITYPGDGLGPASGTAFASAYVAATAALVRSYRPALSGEEVAHRLFATATPAPEAAGSPRYGYGIVNPYQAVLERVVDGAPVAREPHRPSGMSAGELARREASQRSDSLAAILAGAGLALAVAMVAAVTFGAKGRRRRWRTGLARVPQDRPAQVDPQPPIELFHHRQKRMGG